MELARASVAKSGTESKRAGARGRKTAIADSPGGVGWRHGLSPVGLRGGLMTDETTRSDGMPASFQPGMRFSGGDVGTFILAGAFAWWAIGRNGVWLAWVTAFVVGNFFLFCNVFRVARSLELVWTIVFVLLAGARLQKDVFEWSTIYMLSGALTIALIVVEMRKPSYHGMGWRTLNPGLREWWLKNKGARSGPEVQPLQAGD
jgi:hypothetical protein